MGSVQNFILFFCVWCESRELRSKGSSRSSCVTSVVENFTDRVPFRILPNISDRALLRKQPTALTLVSRCLSFAFVSLCSMLCFFSPSMNLFCTFICLIFFKFSVSCCKNSEAVVWRCFVEKVFLESTSSGCFWKLHYGNK